MNLFELVSPAPVDPILGLSEAFKADTNPKKINLSVGVYQDEDGKVPVLSSVKKAERYLVENEGSKTYLSMTGSPEYTAAAQELVFGYNNEMVSTQRIVSAQTPGGTGGLRVAGDFVRRVLGQRTVWMSTPTWANHRGIFEACDLPTAQYPYLDRDSNDLNLSGMITVLENVPENDVVLLHACCHNPTGVDPSADDWETIAKVCKQRNLLPLLDFAYQGFGHGLVDDAVGVRALSEYGLEFIVCSSFSKNFGLYRERVGALHIVCKNREEAERINGNVKLVVRTNYSNPPSHGAAIVATILADRELKLEWEEELGAMRKRIQSMRDQLVAALNDVGAPGDWAFVSRQNGMFTLLPLSDDHVQRLRDEDGIYIVKGGRINVAGLNKKNISILAEAIARVLR